MEKINGDFTENGNVVNFLPGIEIPALLLLAGMAFFVEKQYTARWTVAANGVILLTTFGIGSLFVNDIFSWYLIGGAVASIITVVSYIKGISLFEEIHIIFHLLYSSKTVLGVVIAAMLNILSIAIIPIAIIWAIAIHYFGHPLPF